MKKLGALLFFCCLLCSSELYARDSIRTFVTPAPSFNKARFWGLTGGIVGVYGGALGVLSVYWYKDYPRSKFHFFNDGREWMGIDKAGHVYAGYFISRWTSGMYRWSGLNHKQAAWAGGASSFLLLSSIEILDAFSSQWGFSGWDLLANTTGAMLATTQELIWQEQRITIKMSALPQQYPDDVKPRAESLFGGSGIETALKDYNATVIWASVNIYSFMRKERRFPKWLNFAVGYGANGMLGGFDNRWCENEELEYCDCPPSEQVDRSDIQRYHQVYLSLDVDFTKVETKHKGVKVLLHLLNLIKVPSPTMEFRSNGKVKFHPLFF